MLEEELPFETAVRLVFREALQDAALYWDHYFRGEYRLQLDLWEGVEALGPKASLRRKSLKSILVSNLMTFELLLLMQEKLLLGKRSFCYNPSLRYCRMKFLVDECAGAAIVQFLRNLSYDVVAVAE
jgi:hypothetical protein